MALKLTKDEMSRLPDWAKKQIESQSKCDNKLEKNRKRIKEFRLNLEIFQSYNTELYEIVVNKCIIDKEKGGDFFNTHYISEGEERNYRDLYAEDSFRGHLWEKGVSIFFLIIFLFYFILFCCLTGPMQVGTKVYF